MIADLKELWNDTLTLSNFTLTNLELSDNMITFNNGDILMKECTLKGIHIQSTHSIIFINEGIN